MASAGQVGRRFPQLVAGNAVSAYGSYLNLVALNLFVLQITGNALSVGIFLIIRIGFAFLAGYTASRVVAHVDRRYVMAGCDLVQALSLLGFALLPDGGRTAVLYGLAAVMGWCGTLSGVALRSSVPDIVGQDLRIKANGQLVTGRSVAMVLGFASAGVVVAAAGYTSAFLVDAASFLFSAVAYALLPRRAGGRDAARRTAAEGTPADEETGRGARRTGAGRLRRLRGSPARAAVRLAPVVVCLVAVRAVDNMGSASHQVGLPVYAAGLDPDGAAAFVGRFYAVWAVGCLLAHQLVSRVPTVARWAGSREKEGGSGGERAFAVGTCLMSGFFILAFAGLPLPTFLAVAIGAGMADGFTEIVYNSRLQALPGGQRERVLGLASMAETAALGVGTLGCASLLDHFAPLTVVTLAHGTAILLALGLLVLLVTVPGLTGEGRPDVRRPGPVPAGRRPAEDTSRPARDDAAAPVDVD
ncbi:MFS transporter [Streptomyces sp. NPDC005925]|uniref:MFS transporter n=1 Tax=Streptomyces sp. NPDC005925 TaxID=3157172 RepID=UPI0033D70782